MISARRTLAAGAVAAAKRTSTTSKSLHLFPKSSSSSSSSTTTTTTKIRFFSDAAIGDATTTTGGGGGTLVIHAPRPLRRQGITIQERTALRAARKERATQFLVSQQQAQSQAQAQQSTSTNTSSSSPLLMAMSSSKWVWYVGVIVPSAVLAWGIADPDSPPARFANWIGWTDLIQRWTEDIAKPSHAKLLPDWSQIPNIPPDIPVPHTLVLDLENTLVSSTWDRKHGWRHAKRPGVDKFLHDMAQYYEIVLYSPSIDGIADPVVTALDKDLCIMHRLYRDATYYHNGVHVKDLNSLNRSLKRMVVLDDDPAEVQFHPQNLIRVKPYTDPNDRTDNTLERITPFLIEIAREGYDDIPALLQQYQGMDADDIADEQDRRIQQLRSSRQRRAQQGLGGLANRQNALPEPELPEVALYQGSSGSSSGAVVQLTAKDIAGAAPSSTDSDVTAGFMAWMNRRAKEKEEHQMRKMEKWNEVMMKKQREKRKQQQQ